MLVHAIRAGTTAQRIRAIQLVPLGVSALREAVVGAATDPDEAVSTAALVRRFEAPRTAGGYADEGEREGVTQKLLALVDKGPPSSLRAKGALARAHVQRVVASIEKDARSVDPARRAEAGAAFAVLGDLGRAVLIAADPDPRVRDAVSCAVLRAGATR